MIHMDCLSRQVMLINNITIEDEVLYKQLADTKLKDLATELEFKENKYFVLIDGLVFRKYQKRQLFVIPKNMVINIIRIHHDELGHVGIDKTIQGIVKNYWFAEMKIKVRQYIDNCVKCLSNSLASGKREGTMELVEITPVPFHTLHLDHFGPLEETSKKYKYILVVADAYTKFVWLFPCVSTTSEQVISHMNTLLNLFGTPEKIISDRGTAFSANSFAKFINENNIKHSMTAVASPWANGAVERVNRFLKSTLAKLIDNPADWANQLGRAQYIINNTFHKSINTTPSRLLLGYDQRNSTDKELREFINKLVATDQNIEQEREGLRDTAKLVNRAVQEYNKSKYDARHKKPNKYNEGDFVMIRVLQHKPGSNQKLAAKYKGPYQIKKVLRKNRFVVSDIPGYNLTQKPLNTILSADKIKPWIKIGEIAKESTEQSDE